MNKVKKASNARNIKKFSNTLHTKYKEEILNEISGKAIQYWMTYCQIVTK